ncbi:MAG TPA: hypothetical protein VIF62_04635 [Labilithrix sp.]
MSHLAHLRAAYGEVLGDAELVLPNGEFFPDEFKLDPESVDRLLRRMMTYAPLSADLEVKLGFVEAEDAGGGGCGGGACSTKGDVQLARSAGAIETSDGYAVLVHVGDTGDTKLLTASLARAIGRLVLFCAEEDVDPRDEGAAAELTAVACGLGPILLGGASVYKKGCGGVRRHQATFLGPEELALATALFVRVRDAKAGAVKKYLEPTQAEAWEEALAWVDSQPKLVRTLAEEPSTLEDGVFSFEEKKGVLARLFTRKKEDEAELDAPVPSRRVRTPEEERRIAETKALVEEALQEP